MAEALLEAQRSLDVGEFPVGAVVILDDTIVARAHWRRHQRQAATLYTTLEPCALCMAPSISVSATFSRAPTA